MAQFLVKINPDGLMNFDWERFDEENEREAEKFSALCKGTAKTAFARYQLYRAIQSLERLSDLWGFRYTDLLLGYIKDLKKIHNSLRDADEFLCEGMGLPEKRFNERIYDTPQLTLDEPVPDDYDDGWTREIMKSEEIWEGVEA